MALDGFTHEGHMLYAGIYALLRRGRVVYIGKSVSLLKRVYSHRYNSQRAKALPFGPKRMLFDDIQVMPCAPDDMDRLEREMINRYRPQYNVHWKAPSEVPLTVPLEVDLGNGHVFTLNPAPQAQGLVRRC